MGLTCTTYHYINILYVGNLFEWFQIHVYIHGVVAVFVVRGRVCIGKVNVIGVNVDLHNVQVAGVASNRDPVIVAVQVVIVKGSVKSIYRVSGSTLVDRD